MNSKTSLLLTIGALALLAPAAASAQMSAQETRQGAQDQSAISKARAAHVAALKSGDKAQIARTEAALKAADVNYSIDMQTDRSEATISGSPDVRAAQLAVDQAREAHQHALVSGDKAEIDKTAAAQRTADFRYYEVTHPKKHRAG
jgi:hypothetical protein